MKLQEMLDAYGASCQCKNWNGWVRECKQHADMVVNKFNEIVEEFRKQKKWRREWQVKKALTEIKKECHNKNNWCRNQAHYMTLFGENNAPNEFIQGVSI